tara:strand:- start:29 stop:445 length:417 start_codon:yes stop_codon:yes gene_type:complete
MNYEDEINNILSSIKPHEYKPLNLIKERRDYIINHIFSNFMKYENNEINLKEALEILEEYEYIEDNNTIEKGDNVRYFNMTAFYDLKLTNNVKILNITDLFIVGNGMYINTIKQNNHFFKKIHKDTLVKMKLMELIQD